MSFSRRSFLKGSASAATIATLKPSLANGLAAPVSGQTLHGLGFTQTANQIRITGRNGIVVDFVLRGKNVKGIGAVSLGGKPLRNASECIWPEMATPYGSEVCALELMGVKHEDGAVIISTRPLYRVIHRMEWTEHAMHPLVNTTSWTKEPSSFEGSKLDWIIREVTENYEDVDYHGFSYGFRYQCPQHPIYQIEDKATWELGGNIEGNGFIMRGANRPHTQFAHDTRMYSGWEYPGIANPHIFQHKPLYTQMQGFTFQYDDADTLITVHEHPSHVRSLFQRQGGQAALLHFNQFCFDLTTEHTTPARKILVGARKKGNDATLANHYLRVRDVIQEQNRKYYGLRYDKTRPSSHVESQGLANPKGFEPVFKQLNTWGIKRAFIMPLWRSPDSDINPLFEKDRKKFGIFGNLCCPLEYEIADCYGAWDGFRAIMQQAQSQGVETYFWHSSHLSSITPLTDKIPDLFCRDVNGQYNRNNYGHVLWAVNQRSPHYQEYLLATYRKAKDCGLKGIFHDSHFNLATDTINFLHTDYYKENPEAPRGDTPMPTDAQGMDQILSMHDTSLKLQSQLQDLGFFYYVESEGSLGTPMTSPDYEYIRGNEFIYSNMDSGLEENQVNPFGDDLTMTYFRGLSARLTYQISVDPNLFPEPRSVASWWNAETMVALNHAFAQVEDHMDKMCVLEEDRGMLWKGRNAEVIFAYKDFGHALDGRVEVLNVTSNRSYTAEKTLSAKKLGIYLLKKA